MVSYLNKIAGDGTVNPKHYCTDVVGNLYHPLVEALTLAEVITIYCIMCRKDTGMLVEGKNAGNGTVDPKHYCTDVVKALYHLLVEALTLAEVTIMSFTIMRTKELVLSPGGKIVGDGIVSHKHCYMDVVGNLYRLLVEALNLAEVLITYLNTRNGNLV